MKWSCSRSWCLKIFHITSSKHSTKDIRERIDWRHSLDHTYLPAEDWLEDLGLCQEMRWLWSGRQEPDKSTHVSTNTIVVDSFSNWPEVVPVKRITTANIIDAFENIFTQHGYPTEIVTDIGTQFTLQDFTRMCETHSIKNSFSAPYFLQRNGRVERVVDIFKRFLVRMQNEGNMSTIIRKFLKTYQTTPSHPLGGKTPARMFTGRKFRTELDMVLPKPSECIASMETTTQQNHMKKNFGNRQGARGGSFDTN